MANDKRQTIPCEMIRDLLPNYIDGLTGSETSAIIAAHLDACPECKAAYEAMRQTVPKVAASPARSPEDEKKVRYLKKIKRKQRITILSVVAVLLVVFSTAYYFVSLRIYPFPVEKMQVSEVYQLESGGLYIRVRLDDQLAALGVFSSLATYTDDNGNAVWHESDDVSQYEYQLGYRAADLWGVKDKVESGYFYFIVDSELLARIDAVYFRGWSGDERLLLWQQGDATLTAPDDVEAMVSQNHVNFGNTYMVAKD